MVRNAAAGYVDPAVLHPWCRGWLPCLTMIGPLFR